MAKLTLEEIRRFIPQIIEALNGLVHGHVTIDVRGGHVANVKRSPEQYVVQNGRAVGQTPEHERGDG